MIIITIKIMMMIIYILAQIALRLCLQWCWYIPWMILPIKFAMILIILWPGGDGLMWRITGSLIRCIHLNSCYRSCAHRQSLLCLQLRADEANGLMKWKMTLKPCLCDKTTDNCDKSYWFFSQFNIYIILFDN